MIASEFLKTFKLEFPELYHVIFIDLYHHSFMGALLIIGGPELKNEISDLYSKNVSSYRIEILQYFRDNIHKHNEWVAIGKLYLL